MKFKYFIIWFKKIIRNILKTPNENDVKKFIKIDPDNIRYIDDPSENIIKYAISLKYSCIKYIKAPSEELIEYAISISPDSFFYITKIDPTFVIKCLEKKYWLIFHIKKPLDEYHITILESLKSTHTGSLLLYLRQFEKSGIPLIVLLDLEKYIKNKSIVQYNINHDLILDLIKQNKNYLADSNSI